MRESILDAVEKKFSKVNRVNFKYNPMEVNFNKEQLITSPILEKYKFLFEWCYGYRNVYHEDKKTKRRTPSAGALYPIDLILISKVDGEIKYLIYDFISHEFYDLQMLSKDVLQDNESRVVFFSVFWRTVQKYGVRGYRYSLLDASFILKNFQRFYPSAFELIIGPVFDGDFFCQFHKDVKPILSILLDDMKINTLSTELFPLVGNTKKISKVANFLPEFSTNLVRTLKIYEKSLKNINLKLSLTSLDDEDLDNKKKFSLFRNSSHSFHKKTILLQDFNLLCSRLKEKYLQLKFGFKTGIAIFCIISNVEGKKAGIESITDSLFKEINIDEPQSKLFLSCQEQTLVLNSCFSFIICLKNKLDMNEFNYPKEVLAAGMICDDIYKICFEMQIGTTTIGNLSDVKFSELFGLDEYTVLVAQVCGFGEGITIKEDNTNLINIKWRIQVANATFLLNIFTGDSKLYLFLGL